jgi:tetratricopeptide (TPR) repeat protein
MKIIYSFFRIILLLSLFLIISVGFSVNNDSLKIIVETQNGIEKATTLNLLGNTLLLSNPEQALVYFKKAHKLTKGKDYTNEISIISNLVEAYGRIRNYDSSDMYIEEGLALCRAAKDTVRMMEFLTNMGRVVNYKGDYSKAKDFFDEAGILYKEYIDHHPNTDKIVPMNFASLLNNKATIFARMGYYDSAIIVFKESLEFRQKHKAGPKYIAPTLLNIGAVCYKNENYTQALEYFNDALDNYLILNDSSKIAACYSNSGLVNKELGDTLKAINNYKKALEIRNKINDTRGKITLLNNLGAIYLKMNQLEKANRYFLKAIRLNANQKYKSKLATSYQNLSTYHNKVGNFDKALEFALKSLNIMKQRGQRANIEEVYLSLSEAYQNKGDYEKALTYYKMHKAIHDSIFNEKSRANYNKLELQLETAQKERKIELLKQEREKQLLQNKILKNEKRNYIATIIVIVFLGFILGFIVLLKRKKDRQIHHQKELVHQKEKELAKAELEKSKIKETELQQSVLYKSKQLSTHALHMMQKNSLLHDIYEKVESISKKVPIDDRPVFRKVLNKINFGLRSQKDWDVFKLYFEEVNRDFYKELKQINPELTINDHRICALIKLNMTSKEMASVLNVAPNSIKSSRYRLKKKLGLSPEADMDAYIRSL